VQKPLLQEESVMRKSGKSKQTSRQKPVKRDMPATSSSRAGAGRKIVKRRVEKTPGGMIVKREE